MTISFAACAAPGITSPRELDQPLRLADAAREAYLSPFHYHRLFVRRFGETPLEFLTRLRIDRAKQLLVPRPLPVTDVCFAVGYESLGSFSTRFRTGWATRPGNFSEGCGTSFPCRSWRCITLFPTAT